MSVRTHGYVFKSNGHWHMQVRHRREWVALDNSGTWESMFREAFKTVSALELLEHIGHKVKLKSFYALVDEEV